MHDRYPNTMADPERRLEEYHRQRRRKAGGRRRAKGPAKATPYPAGFVPRHRAGSPR